MTNDEKTKLNKRIKQIALPAMIGFLFSTLFNVVDSFYAGQISTDAIAGMTLAFPVYILLISLANGVGSGLNALAAIAVGKNNQKEFLDLFKSALFIAIALGIIVPFLTPWLSSIIFNIQDADAIAITYGLRYIGTMMIGFVFFMINFTFNGILYAQGNSKPFRNFLMVATVVNIILNPILIHGFWIVPPLDTAGIGLATLLVQFGGSFYLLYKVLKSEWVSLEGFKKACINKISLLSLAHQSIPASLNIATIALGVFVINYFVQLYGGTSTLAAYGIAIRIEQLALVPTLGLNVAVITLVGQNFGASNFEGIYATWKRATIGGLIIMGVGLIIIVPFAPYLIGLFDSSPAVINAGTRYLRIEALAFLSYVFLNISISMLQGIKKPMFALWIGIYRQLLPIGLFYLLGTILSMGIDGVWWGIVLINWTAVMLTLSYATLTLKRVREKNA